MEHDPAPALRLSLPPHPAHLSFARDRIRTHLEHAQVACGDVDVIVLCVEEACTNAMRHAGSHADIEVVVRFEGRDLVAEISDAGRGFDVATADFSSVPHPLSSGGRGLFLMAALMDELKVSSNGGVAVRMVKRGVAAGAADDFSLSDLIDIESLQDLLDKCSDAFAFPTAIIDNEANVLTFSGWQDICTRFHRRHPETLRECRKSDLHIFSHIRTGEESVTYSCPRGMIESASPIVIDGRHLGNVFIGQVFTEEPDLERFRAQARRFGFDGDAYVEAASRVPVLSRDDLARRIPFMRGLAEMVAAIGLARLRDRKLNRQLEARVRENAHLYEQQRRIAETLQENLIHPLPQVNGLELGLVSRTAHQPELVGGDFSDVFLIDATTVAVLIGDVAGKGIRAAGLTETVRATVRAFAMVDRSPAFILRKTSQLLLRRDGDEELVTAFLLVLDIGSGEAHYASAAHPAPVHIGRASCRPLDTSFGTPLGAFDRDYVNGHATLAPGDCLVLYTDGVTEARRNGELYGEQRLATMVATLRGLPAQVIAEGVRESVAGYAGRLRDDLHVVVVARPGEREREAPASR